IVDQIVDLGILQINAGLALFKLQFQVALEEQAIAQAIEENWLEAGAERIGVATLLPIEAGKPIPGDTQAVFTGKAIEVLPEGWLIESLLGDLLLQRFILLVIVCLNSLELVLELLDPVPILFHLRAVTLKLDL